MQKCRKDIEIKGKESGALPREEVTDWPDCKAKAPGDSSATITTAPSLGSRILEGLRVIYVKELCKW